MAVRSRRLFGPANVPSGAATALYTVPSGRTAVVRSLVVANTSLTVAGSGSFRINGTTSGFTWWWIPSIAVGDTWSADVVLILNPLDVLYFRQDTGANALRVTGGGSLLLGEPE